jgi:hypothetical protein
MPDREAGIEELHQRIPFLLSQLGVYLAEDFVHRLEPFGVEPRAYAVMKALRTRRAIAARAVVATSHSPQRDGDGCRQAGT